MFRIMTVIVILLSPDFQAYAEMMEHEVEIEEVCCACNEKKSLENIVPDISERKVSEYDYDGRHIVKASVDCRCVRDNFEIAYCVFRE